MIARLAITLAAAIGAALALLWMVVLVPLGSGKRLTRIAVGIDNAVSACFGGDGRTTISTRAARARASGARWGCVLCRVLDALDPDHCEKSR